MSVKRFVKCPSCRTAMGLGEDKVGQNIQCPKCQGVFHTKWKRKPFNLMLKDLINKAGYVSIGILIMLCFYLDKDTAFGGHKRIPLTKPVSFKSNDLNPSDHGIYIFYPDKNIILPVPSLNEGVDWDNLFKNKLKDHDDFFDKDFEFIAPEQAPMFLNPQPKIAIWNNGQIPISEISCRRKCVCPTPTPTVKKDSDVRWIQHPINPNSYYKYVFSSNTVINSKFEEELIYNNKTYKIWVFNGLAPRISDFNKDGKRYVLYDYSNGVEIAKCQLPTESVVVKKTNPEEITGVNIEEPVIKNKLRKPSEFQATIKEEKGKE